MMQNKKIVGITGGSGCGKSHMSGLLRSRGIPVIDCDLVSREIMVKGEPCYLEVLAEFGDVILQPDGEINRKNLGEIVFSDPEKLEKLNKITHKHILADIYNKIEKEDSNIIGLDGAVLIESGIECDFLVGVLADKELRIQRIMARDSLSKESAKRRIEAQKQDSFYIENCDFVVYNNGNEYDIDDLIKRIADET